MTLWKKLDDYQKDAVDWAIPKSGCGLFFDQGTGKTWIVLGVIERILTPDFSVLLVVPLTNKISTWAKLLAAQLPQVTVCMTLEAFTAAEGRPRAMLLHYEELTPQRRAKRGSKVDWRFRDKLAKIDWSLIVFDECHRLKDRNSLQSKAAAKFRNCDALKMGLSGTPSDGKPSIDLWAQFRFFAPEVFGDRWGDFEDEFLEPVDVDLDGVRPGSFRWHLLLRKAMIAKGKRKIREDMEEEFIRRIKPYCLRVDANDVLDLPGLRIKPCPVVLRGRQARIYNDIEKRLVSHIGQSRVTSPLRVTQLIKMQQICGGYVFDDEGQVQEVGTSKMLRVMSLIRTKKKPIVVFCRYLEEVWALHDELVGSGLRVETLTGKTKKKRRPEIQDRFQRGKIDVLIAQIRTGGVGIDLFRSCVGIMYSITYSFIDYDQALKRLFRRGQENIVEIFLVFARGTIDEDIFEAIVTKRNLNEHVLIRLKQRRRDHGRQENFRGALFGKEVGHRGSVSSRRAA